MHIGIIVEGEGEFEALPFLMEKINSPHTILNPRLVNRIHPEAPAATIANRAKSAVKQLVTDEQAERILVVFDHEKRLQKEGECIPTRRAEVEGALAKECADLPIDDIKVILKNRQFENWLLGDCDALPKKFSISEKTKQELYPNNVDGSPAATILKTSVTRPEIYHKRHDPIAIVKAMDPYEAARHSRSFRRFLRLLGCPAYLDQSKNPAPLPTPLFDPPLPPRF